MKNIKILITSFLMLGITFLIASCEPESHTLGKLLDKSEIDFEITQDFTADAGGNTVIMTNKTNGVVLTWDYVIGRSDKKTETVKYAFKGDYTIKISAVTASGIVQLDPVTITVTDDNLGYVDDPLWTNLSGGVDHEKSWVLDNGKYGFAPGALSYADISGTVEWNDFSPNWEPEGNPPGSVDENMNWGSYMTFSLEGGPFMKVYDKDDVLQEDGTYFLDANSHTLSTTDATILRPTNYIENASNWNTDVKVVTLTENQLRIAILRTNDEGPWWYIWNYVSKEYADNYVPEDVPDPNPAIDLNGSTVDDLLSVTASTSKTWHLSPDTPFNWTDLNGAFLNDWNSVEDYPGWAAFTAADQATVVNNKITFADDGTVTTIDSNGIEAAGIYETSTDGTNIISFTDIKPSFPIGNSWANVSTTDENQWKIVKTGLTGSTVTDIWFGKRDEVKSEYMVFHFVLEDGSSDPIEENKKLIISSLTGGSSRVFKISDSWPVDWADGEFNGGWTGPTTFEDPVGVFPTGWLWSAESKAGVQDPTLTFTKDGENVTVTKVQDGVTTTADVVIDAENSTLEINMDLIAIKGPSSWLPTNADVWYIGRNPLSAIETDGMWLGKLGVNGDGDPEITAFHYIVQ